MKKRDMETIFDGMRSLAAKRYPEKETAEEQYKAYGKFGLLIFCQNRSGFTMDKYYDLLETFEAVAV